MNGETMDRGRGEKRIKRNRGGEIERKLKVKKRVGSRKGK